MPIYEYKCSECGYEFEEIQKFNDLPITVCPKCGGKVYKKLSAPAFKFKGSGWYVTDYSKNSYKEASEKKENKKEVSKKDKKTKAEGTGAVSSTNT